VTEATDNVVLPAPAAAGYHRAETKKLRRLPKVRRKTFWLAPALLLLAAATGARAQGDERVTVDEFKRLVASNSVVVLDVRNEQIERKIKGALHMPYNDIGSRARELPRNREIITYCA
jgi:hypothetical protein